MTLLEALHVLLPELDSGPFIYGIRDRAREDAEWHGNSWDHPRVKQAAEAISVIKAFINV